MSWLFSQALVEEYSEGISLDGAQSAQSSGKPTQQAYCAPDKMTAFSRLSRFGMTYKPLTATHGEALLMSYLAAFHAKTSQPRGGGAGIDGERSGMWREMARIIGEIQPRYVFVENSPMLTSRGLGRVLGDLASMGFDARWGVLGAADIGANHQRDRIWIVGKQMGNTHDNGQITSEICKSTAQRGDSGSARKKQASQLEGSSEQYAELADSTQHRTQSESCKARKSSEWSYSSSIGDSRWWSIEPNVGRVAYGLADRMDRLKAIGNGQVPLCAATAWRILSDK